jgi:hypothetical protein
MFTVRISLYKKGMALPQIRPFPSDRIRIRNSTVLCSELFSPYREKYQFVSKFPYLIYILIVYFIVSDGAAVRPFSALPHSQQERQPFNTINFLY